MSPLRVLTGGAVPGPSPGGAASFDCRVREAAGITTVDPVAFHEELLPEAMDRNGRLASEAFAASGLSRITICVQGRDWNWGLDGDARVEVLPGDAGHGARAVLDAQWFSDIVNDLRSTTALMIAGEVEMTRGDVTHLVAWEPVLRALLEARPAYRDGLVDFLDRNAEPLELGRTFTLDDDPDEVRHFLAQAGFAHFRGVFSGTEMDELGAEMDRWFDSMTPGDDRSWYATTDEGSRCVRVTNLPTDAVEFPHEARLAPIAAIAGAGHRYAGTDLLVKPVGVTEGLSDLPWHKDCALGGHTYGCTSLTCGVSVTASGADNGQLGVLAGSHRVNIPSFSRPEGLDLPALWLTTEPGDVTVHLSCTLHCATPPVHSERRVTYSSFRLPGASEVDRRTRETRDRAGRDTYAPR